jgi:WD40 repeat protein/uncharacterized caspase-like protein
MSSLSYSRNSPRLCHFWGLAMRRRIAFLWLLLCLATPAFADNRIALVIGNSTYAGVGALPNPRSDAALLADTLGREGFTVTLVQDATREAMLKALRTFSDDADQADWAIVYYAGHGIEIGGVNYLLPIDVELKHDRDAQDEAITLNRVLEAAANAHKLRLVILDACRNNPFALTMRRSYTRSVVNRGLAPADPPRGTVVVYAAQAGEVASDGSSDHSPFAAALARRIQEPGLEISRLINLVTADVFDVTRGDQTPSQYGSNASREAFYFVPPAPPPAPLISDSAIAATIDGATSADQLTSLIAILPDGPLREHAKARAEALKKAQSASLAPEAPKPEPASKPPPPAPTPLISDGPIAAGIDAARSADQLTLLLAVLPEGPLKEQVKARAEALTKAQTPSVAPEPPKPEPASKPPGAVAALTTPSISDGAIAASIDAATSADQLTLLLAILPEGPLKEQAKARAEALKKTQTAALIAAPPKSESARSTAPREYVLPEGAAITLQLGHTSYVNSVAISPDGRFVVSGSSDAAIKIWDIASGRLLQTLGGEGWSVNSVAISPDGRFIVSGGIDALTLWDAASGKPLRTFEGQKGSVDSVAFSPDGQSIASGGEADILDKGEQHTLQLWETATGKLLRNFEGQKDEVTSVAFSRDGRSIVCGTLDKAVKLWDVATGKLSRTFAGHDYAVHSVAFSIDGRMIVSGSADNTVKLWDVDSGKLLRSFAEQEYIVGAVAFSPDGLIVSAGDVRGVGGATKFWEPDSGKEARSFEGSRYSDKSLAFSPDGSFFIRAGDSDGAIEVWDTARGKLRRTLSGNTAIHSVAFSPDGRFILSGDEDGALRLWDAFSGKLSRTFGGHSSSVDAITFAPGGKSIVSGSGEEVKVWDIASGRLLISFQGPSDGLVSSVAISSDGRFIVSGAYDKTVRLWDTTNGKLLRTFTGHTAAVASVAFAPDGRTIASGGSDNLIKLWDVASGRLRRTLQGHQNSVELVAFTSDGRSIVAGDASGYVKLWDVASGKLRRSLFKAQRGDFYALSRDGASIATGSYDHSLDLWDVDTGNPVRALDGQGHPLKVAAFAPDGRTMVSGAVDGTLKLWDVLSGALLATYAQVDGQGIAVLPDNHFATDGDPDKALAIVRGFEEAPLDDFIAANRRVTLADEFEGLPAASKAP